MGKCKYFISQKGSTTGGLCGYVYLCPYLYNDEISCPNKKIVREYEDRKKQFDPPTPEEKRKVIESRVIRRYDDGYVKKW